MGKGDTVPIINTHSDKCSDGIKQLSGSTGWGKLGKSFQRKSHVRDQWDGEAHGWGGKESGSCKGNSMYKGLEAKHCRLIINVSLKMNKTPNPMSDF